MSIKFENLDSALKKLLSNVSFYPEIEEVEPLNSYKRVLAEDLISPIDLPIRDISHVDGFAIRAEDTKGASKERSISLKIKGKVWAGEFPSFTIKKGEAAKVFTGAYIPDGADSMVMLEEVIQRDGKILISREVKRGEEVILKGSDFKKGSLILEKGSFIKAQHIGMLMNFGIKRIKVFRRPKIAIMPVGSELSDNLEDFEKGKIIDSHSWIIAKLIEENGGEAIHMGIVEDDLNNIHKKLKEGLKYDMIMTIGGSSLGEKDLVHKAINSIGKPGVLVHGLKLQPGRVAGFGVVDGKPIFILPGLIQSTINSFIFLAYPCLQYYFNREPKSYSIRVKAQLEEDLKFKRYRDFKKVSWVKLNYREGNYYAKPIFGMSPMTHVIGRADGYVLIEAYIEEVKRGEEVFVNLIDGL
ncbi:MAG: molybdopterin molybdotransferase MoeA [Nitrososphaerales archaeon]